MENFRCVTETIHDIREELVEIHLAMLDALAQAETAQRTLDNPNNWQGEAQLVGAAFLSLVVAYHRKLSTPDGDTDPILEATETLQEYLDHDSVFYEQWKEHQALSDI